MAAINFDKLRKLGYESIDDLPADMLKGLDEAALAQIGEAMPTRRVVVAPDPIDYGKGKNPTRAALVRALKQRDREIGVEGESLTEAATRILESALQGNMGAFAMIADRLDGKPSQEVAVDVHVSLEALIMQSIKLEAEPVQVLDADQKAITIDQ